MSPAGDSPQWTGLLRRGLPGEEPSSTLRYQVVRVFEEVLRMEQSATYQAIRRRERTEEARRILLLQGETKFGPPDPAARAAIEQLDDLAQREALGGPLGEG
jgi:hypothetical protein